MNKCEEARENCFGDEICMDFYRDSKNECEMENEENSKKLKWILKWQDKLDDMP